MLTMLPEAARAQWSKLPAIPDREGFAGSFAGTSGDQLLVAGGANFPDKRPWEGGTKAWYDTVFALEAPRGKEAQGVWRSVGKLPAARGYGVSVTLPEGFLCVGGSESQGHTREVVLVAWKDGKLEVRRHSQLPVALANACGALLGETVFVAGGIETPGAIKASELFLACDLGAREPAWRTLPTWPGRERMLSVAAAEGDAFYLFGGTALKKGPDGAPEREWLRDAYRYRPADGWKRLADLPRAAVAAPSPAPVLDGKLLALGGDDGSQIKTQPTEHRGFPRDVLAYDPAKDRWERSGDVPFSLVTTPAVRWRDQIVIPGGEARPGVRSTEVWSAPLHHDPKRQ